MNSLISILLEEREFHPRVASRSGVSGVDSPPLREQKDHCGDNESVISDLRHPRIHENAKVRDLSQRGSVPTRLEPTARCKYRDARDPCPPGSWFLWRIHRVAAENPLKGRNHPHRDRVARLNTVRLRCSSLNNTSYRDLAGS